MPEPGVIYVMDRGYIDFVRLHVLHQNIVRLTIGNMDEARDVAVRIKQRMQLTWGHKQGGEVLGYLGHCDEQRRGRIGASKIDSAAPLPDSARSP